MVVFRIAYTWCFLSFIITYFIYRVLVICKTKMGNDIIDNIYTGV